MVATKARVYRDVGAYLRVPPPCLRGNGRLPKGGARDGCLRGGGPAAGVYLGVACRGGGEMQPKRRNIKQCICCRVSLYKLGRSDVAAARIWFCRCASAPQLFLTRMILR